MSLGVIGLKYPDIGRESCGSSKLLETQLRFINSTLQNLFLCYLVVKMSVYQLYRNTTLGNTLQESLDELIQVGSFAYNKIIRSYSLVHTTTLRTYL